MPPIDPTHPHAEKAQETADHLTAEGVDPILIAQVVQLILQGIPAVKALLKTLKGTFGKS